MDLVNKLYANLGIDKKQDPFVKTASKKASPLSHFGIRNDLDYDYDGENVDKKKEVVEDKNFDKKKEAILNVLEAPNMYDHLPKRWEVIASITGLKDPQVAFNKNYDSYVNLSDRSRCALAYTKESDHKVNEWYDQLTNKKADENLTKEEAFEKIFHMLSNDVRMRIKWQIEDPIGEKSAEERNEIIREIEEFGGPDDQWLIKKFKEKYASKREAQDAYPPGYPKKLDEVCQVCQKPEVYEFSPGFINCGNCGRGRRINPDGSIKEQWMGGAQGRKAQSLSHINWKTLPCKHCGKSVEIDEFGEKTVIPCSHCGKPIEKSEFNFTGASKKTADSINDELNTQTHDSYLESIGDQVDDKDMDKNHVHGSPIDNNKSVIDDMLTSDPTPPVYAPSASDGLLFDTLEKENPTRDMPLNQDRKEFEGVNGRKKAVLASMQKSGQKWEYYLQALTKLKSLDGKPMLRKVFDDGYYPILQDMVAKGFAEFKKIKVTGTTSQIVMTNQGKLALTAVEEKIKQEKEQQTQKAPETVAPTSQTEDLPGNSGGDEESNAPTEEIPMVMPVGASKKTYSIADIDEIAPHIARAMVKKGILFVDRERFDNKYASYIKEVSEVPELKRDMLERKSAELEISPNTYRKLLLAQAGIKVFSHEDFVQKAGTTKAKLYQYKNPGTFVKIGNDEYVVAKITDGEIFLKRAQTGYDSDEEMKRDQETLSENDYRNNKNAKFITYEKKENGEKGKELGYDRAHKGARMRGIANGEGNYIVEVINEQVGPTTANTTSPQIYGVYEFEVRKMPSGGSYPTDGDHLMVMNYHQTDVKHADPATHVDKLVVKEARVTKTAESALKAFYKASERVLRDLSDGSRMFTTPEERKLVRSILDFVDSNIDGLAKIAGVSREEKEQLEEVVEEAKEEVNEAPTEKTENPVEEPKVEEPKQEMQEEVKAGY